MEYIDFGKDIVLEDLYNVLYKNKSINLNSDCIEKLKNSNEFLEHFSIDKVIYGVNTGLGPMAQYRINNSKLTELQYNLIRSHSSGTGAPIDVLDAKAAMLCRLRSLSTSYSGTQLPLTDIIQEMINKDVIPVIYEHGGVGASGDLVQLSHLALALIGEGEVFYKGQIKPAAEVFKLEGIKPLELKLRDGLALINGTSVMSAIAATNLIKVENLINWGIVTTGIINEINGAYSDAFSAKLNTVKHHFGQQKVASLLRKNLEGSQRIRERKEHLYVSNNEDVFKEKVQEYYSMRCAPQIIGPIYDTFISAKNIVVNEINSSNDNPVIDFENEDVLHGGNFHGDYISLEMDKLKIVTTKLSMVFERQLNYLMNNKINEKLPPFVNLGELGINLGVQGMQFTATSTTAENQTLSFPMYVHSIPNNNDNQDIVSMGTNSASMTKRVIENAYQVLSVHLIAIAQAVDYLKIADKLSPYNQEIFKKLRAVVPTFIDDTPKYEEIRKMKEFAISERLVLE